ncbi:MAG: tetratricopeptide repeat protein (plasmid) [Leptolyngbya sp. BL-A-14]
MHPALKSVGLTLLLVGSTTMALYIPANIERSPVLAQTTTTQDRKAEADRLFEQGTKQQAQKQNEAAIASFQQALTIYRQLKERQKEGQTLKSIGNVYLKLKDYPKAITYQQQALAIAHEIKDANLESRALNNLGLAYENAGNLPKGIDYLQQSLTVAEASHNDFMTLTAFNSLVIAFKTAKQPDKVIQTAQTFLARVNALNKPNVEADALIAVANAYKSVDKPKEAIAYFQQAVTIAQRIPKPELEARALLNLADVYDSIEDYSSVIETGESSLAVYQRLGDKSGQLKALSLLTSANFIHLLNLARQGKGSLETFQRSLQVGQQGIRLARELNQPADEANLLVSVAGIYFTVKDYANSMRFYEQALQIDQRLKNQSRQLMSTIQILRLHYLSSNVALSKQNNAAATVQIQQTLNLVPHALQLAKALQNSDSEKEIFKQQSQAYINLARVNFNTRNLDRAAEFAQKGLALAQQSHSAQTESLAMSVLAKVYGDQGEYRKAVDINKLQLAVARRDQANPQAEVYSLSSLASSYALFGNLRQGIEIAQQALQKARAIDVTRLPPDLRDQVPQAQLAILESLSVYYTSLGEFDQAQTVAEQQLQLSRQVNDPEQEGQSLLALSKLAVQREVLPQAVELAQQALAVVKTVKNTVGTSQPDLEIRALSQLGGIYALKKNYPQAVAAAQQALQVAQKSHQLKLEADALDALSAAYIAQGAIPKALESLKRSVAVSRQLSNPLERSTYSMKLGSAYFSLGDYGTSRQLFQQALANAQRVQYSPAESSAWLALSVTDWAEGNTPKAVGLAEKGAAIAQGKMPKLEADSKLILSIVYGEAGNEQNAIAAAQSSLAIYQTLGDRNQQANALAVLGNLQRRFGHSKQALTAYQEALVMLKTSLGSDDSSNAGVYAGLGRLYADRNQDELAIVFYKRAVNGLEDIRHKLQGLPTELQQSFLRATFDFGGIKTVDIYRQLADLLLSQGRIGEAQQVIELLKVQELNDLNPGTRTSTARLAELALNPTEQEIQKQYANLIAFGQRVKDCQQDCSALKAQRQKLFEQFEAYQQTIQKTIGDGTLVRIDERNKDFIASASKIVNAQPNTVLIYPLVLPDKIHLLWASQGGVLSSTTCSIGEKQLTRMAIDFQTALQSPNDIVAVKQQGKALYDCLIKPLEEKGEWEKNNVKHLVIAPDRAINYIPIGALFDGKQFLIERYTTANILNAGLTNIDGKLPQKPSVLGIGISEPLDNFAALPDVKQELETIIRTQQSPQGIYQGSLYLNQASTPSTFEENLGKYSIIHIATHGEFKPSNPNQSYLLFSSGQKGKGLRYTVSQIQQQEALRNVDLVVLSACQTGKGESASSGIEIQGMSAAFVRDRAKAVIASLWNVNDASTALLMQQFYKNLATGKMTKSEALRQAQLSLLQRKLTDNDALQRASLRPVLPPGQRAANSASQGFSHPYYWAPFILIGNGL